MPAQRRSFFCAAKNSYAKQKPGAVARSRLALFSPRLDFSQEFFSAS